MSKPQLLTPNNHVFEGENPPDKQADKGGNAQIRNIDKNGIKSNIFMNRKVVFQRTDTEFMGGKHWQTYKATCVWQLVDC